MLVQLNNAKLKELRKVFRGEDAIACEGGGVTIRYSMYAMCRFNIQI